MLSDECYCSCFWCHISSVPSYCALLCASKCRVLNEWQPVVRCVGCGGLRQWIITVMCWQSLSTPPEALDNYTQMAQLCHLFKKKNLQKNAALTSAFSCMFLLFQQLDDEGFQHTGGCRNEHVPQQDPMLQMPASFPLASSVIREA